MISALLLLTLFAVPSHASSSRPKDFDRFWETTIAKLRAQPLDVVVSSDAEHTDADVACFKLDYTGWRAQKIHARYCRPAADGKYPGVLVSPWYSQGLIPPPVDLAKRGMAALWFQARGFEVDQHEYPTANSWYILDGIEIPETYAYRGIVGAALRGLDVLASRPEVDASRLGAMGASQGGGLSVIVAGLDPRVTAVAADFPFLTDWPDSLAEAPGSPYADVAKRIAQFPEQRAQILETLSYYDTLALADRVAAPALVQAGLADKTCPPGPIKAMFARLKSAKKQLKEWPKADHADEGAKRWAASVDFLAGVLSSTSTASNASR